MAAFDGVNAPTISVQFKINGSWTGLPPSQVREIRIRRGRERQDQANDPGEMICVLDNVTGYYDPEYTGSSSPYVVSGVNQLKAGLQARLRATYGSTTYTLYQGFLETNTLDQGFFPTATMTFTDFSAVLGSVVAPDLASAAYSETTSTRVGRMLTLAGWSGTTNLTGTVTLLPTLQGATTLAMIEECVTCEAGRFYISKDGIPTFLPLSDKFSRPTRLWLSDTRASGSVEYDEIDATPGTYQVVNECVINRPSRSKRRARYKPSVTAYGLKTKEITAPISSASIADKLAVYMARRDAIPTTLVQSIGFEAIGLDILWPDFLDLEIGDQLTIDRRTVDGRDLTIYTVAEGFTFTITADSWRVSIWTSTMNPYSISLT